MKRAVLIALLITPTLASADGYWSLGGVTMSTDPDPGVSIRKEDGAPAFGAGNEFEFGRWSASIDFMYVGAFSVGGMAGYRNDSTRLSAGVGVVDLSIEAPLANCEGAGSKTTEYLMLDAEHRGFYARAMQYADTNTEVSCTLGAARDSRRINIGDGTIVSAGYRFRF